MRRELLAALAAVVALSSVSCKKQVPNDIAQRSIRGALGTHAPLTTSAMCGTKVRGLLNATVSVKETRPDNTGVAHVTGKPLSAPGAPAMCEGDVEFKFTSSTSTATKRTGFKRKKKTTTTTWYLEHMKLVAVQTPGVKASNIDEDPDGDDDDDG